MNLRIYSILIVSLLLAQCKTRISSSQLAGDSEEQCYLVGKYNKSIKHIYSDNVIFSPNGQTYAVRTGKEVRVHDIQTDKILWKIDLFAFHIEFSQDGKFLVILLNPDGSGGPPSRVMLAEAGTGKKLYEFYKARHLYKVVLSNNNRFAAVSGGNGRSELSVFSLSDTATLIKNFELDDSVVEM